MDSFFISKIDIKKVRHLQDVEIDISDTERKHLIFTGKNGSGKTSVLNSVWDLIFNNSGKEGKGKHTIYNDLLSLTFNISELSSHSKVIEITKWNFPAVRNLKVKKSEGVKDEVTNKVEDFEKFLAKKRTEQAFLSFEKDNGKEVKLISDWFDKLESSLRFLFEDESLKLLSKRTEDKLNFYLTSNHREEFDFNTLSSGYSSILYILFDMMQQMQNEGGSFDYSQEGIALIDEVEAHIHISLQKKILPFLTRFFPNVQFIVTTHSPFILQSLRNAVIFDLETKKRYEDFSNYSSESILETFYDMDKFGDLMKQDMVKYEELLQSVNGQNKNEILEMRKIFLEVPDIEVSYWIKDMDIRHRDKIKSLLV
ncbi:MAG TPA: AAA family ATPase [Saprospiraceae bacterium]|jgi:predicted ATP-binding protein involved in virulence|nr:AAA family ATPase [Saprospiraceae bacterium]